VLTKFWVSTGEREEQRELQSALPGFSGTLGRGGDLEREVGTDRGLIFG
jgi:hypothetical protein